jgi:NAD+ synthase
MSELLTTADARTEVDRLVAFVGRHVGTDPAMVLVSGGLDSDVVARLTARAVPPRQLKLVTIHQDEMSDTHLRHARDLAADLGTGLIELDLRGVNLDVVYRLAAADPAEEFDPRGLLDPARMKCSLRTVVMSCYQDRGYVVLGTSNRTEAQLGFYLPFGDGIWHVGPLAHLYKTEVRVVARELGTAAGVLDQPPSAGFWTDQTDREDLGFWLVNRGPIQRERDFSDDEVALAGRFSGQLDEAAVDRFLLALAEGTDVTAGGVPAEITPLLTDIVKRSAVLKSRPIGTTVPRRS